MFCLIDRKTLGVLIEIFFNQSVACSSEKDAKKIEQQVVGVRESERTAVILFIKQKLVPVCQILVYCMIDLN